MIVVDTNVVSELMLPSPADAVIEWTSAQEAHTLYFTTISEAELRYGVAILPIGRRREQLLVAVEHMLREDFAGRVIPFDRQAARAYAAIAAARRAAGRPIKYADCQIAAIARSVGASVATRNVRDFEGCGIDVINPWDAG
jgi:predicted nucleic acid-binding protein